MQTGLDVLREEPFDPDHPLFGLVSSAKTALMTRFLECFALFWAVFRYVLPETLHLREVMTLGLTLPKMCVEATTTVGA